MSTSEFGDDSVVDFSSSYALSGKLGGEEDIALVEFLLDSTSNEFCSDLLEGIVESTVRWKICYSTRGLVQQKEDWHSMKEF